MFYIGLYRENMIKPCCLKLRKWPCPGGHMFYIGLYRENMIKPCCLKPIRTRALEFGM